MKKITTILLVTLAVLATAVPATFANGVHAYGGGRIELELVSQPCDAAAGADRRQPGVVLRLRLRLVRQRPAAQMPDSDR